MIAFTPPGSPKLVGVVKCDGTVLVVGAEHETAPNDLPSFAWSFAEVSSEAYVFRLNATTASIVSPLSPMTEEAVLSLARLPIDAGDRLGTVEIAAKGLAIQSRDGAAPRVSVALDAGRYACVFDEVGDGEQDARRLHLVRTDEPAQRSLF